MFLIQEILRVASNRQTEAVRRLEWIHGLMRPNGGFVRAQVARYLGNPTDYLILRMWDSAADYQAFRQTPEGQDYPKSRPQGLYESQRVPMRWQMVLDAGEAGRGRFLQRSVYAVPTGSHEEFIESRRRHDALALEVEGTYHLLTFRCLEEDPETADTYLHFAYRQDRDAYNRLLESDQAAQYRASLKPGLTQTISTHLYEVVSDIVP